MASLNSPGVSVDVINESYYTPAEPGTRPLFIVASAENKQNASGTGIAQGTLKSNAGVAYLLTSQRDLADTFGDPTFRVDSNNNPIHAGELNEYGLQAAYSYLGVSNSAWVVRADLDLDQLLPLADAPGGTPDNNTLWLDTRDTSYGVFQWDNRTVANGGQSFNNKVPVIVLDSTKLDSGVPKDSVGAIGDYAVAVGSNATNVLSYFYKAAYAAAIPASNTWVKIGSDAWVSSWPVAVSTNTTVPAPGQKFSITVTFADATTDIVEITTVGTTMEGLADDITTNAASVNVAASVDVDRKLTLYATSKTVDSIVLANTFGTPLATIGLSNTTYRAPKLQISTHTQVPQWKLSGVNQVNRPTGSVWIKTTEPNKGSRYRVKSYNAATQLWNQISAPLYPTNAFASYTLDLATGGYNIPVNTVYIHTNDTESVNPEADFRLMKRTASGVTTATTKTIIDTTFALDSTLASFTMAESQVGSNTYAAAKTISFDTGGNASSDAHNLAAAINAAQFVHIVADVNAVNQVIITHKAGGDIKFGEAGVNDTLSLLGLTNVYASPAGDVDFRYIASNWKPVVANTLTDAKISYIIDDYAPSTLESDGQLWYSPVVDDIDLMIHDGNTWRAYRNVYPNTDPAGPIVAATQPITFADGVTPIDAGTGHQLWIDTSDIEHYPLIKRWNGDLLVWELLDNSDQTTENGIIFADARWATSGSATAPATIAELLGGTGSLVADTAADFLDFDAPDPALYPQGMLLWNLRRSGFNVKKFTRNYINTSADNHRWNNSESMIDYYPHRWVSVAANQDDGAGSFGRHAQRKVVIQALTELVNSNDQIRETDIRTFNLMACPGYPELISPMKGLNYDRGITALVVGDSPARLTPDATSLNNWGMNTAGALNDGDLGLVSFDEYFGVFYPWGFSTDNAGNSIVVPPSHMIMRMIALSDQVSYPWFAPAGVRRGNITNASNVGYVTSEGEFKAVALNEGQRDTLYNTSINPITYFTNGGLMNCGQKTRAPAASALDRINVARLVIYLRSQLNKLAKPYIFEPNDKITRDEMKQQIESLLLQLVGQRAIADFLVDIETKNTKFTIDRNELYCDIYFVPVKSVEFIYLPLHLKNTGSITSA